ncbi:lytic transglycosylase domain-containing protein [Candidatus Tokpelaia sp.]|uniref:lytic transglycosylase domain-containing protein n=1 Tax=Candidatus Tokpelaia sp. TaxID=2233777 RepID=UPI001FEE1D47|nr:lytic transglycosylase domain-containing protein [Candidatus Tokpelaia sp.]
MARNWHKNFIIYSTALGLFFAQIAAAQTKAGGNKMPHPAARPAAQATAAKKARSHKGKASAPAARTAAKARPQTKAAPVLTGAAAAVGLDNNPVSAIPPGRSAVLPGLSPRLRAGFDAAYNNRGAEALAAKNAFAAGTAERQSLAWAIATAGPSGVSAAQLWQNKAELAGWPGQAQLQGSFERALAREGAAPAKIIAYFTGQQPQTAAGRAVLARAYIAGGQKAQARAVLFPWWYQARLSNSEETLLAASAAGLLTQEDYRRRLSAQLFAGQKAAAARIAARAGGTDLYQAYMAALQPAMATESLLAGLSAYWKKQAVSRFIYIQYLRRTKHYEKAAQLVSATPAASGAMGNNEAWWAERRVLSREMLDIGRADIAYRLVTAWRPGDKIQAADAEFHAGWYALRFLGRPQPAREHFARLAALSAGTITKARGYYWQGRTAEALHEPRAAQNFYAQAAHYSTTFYGQLAAQNIGRALPPPPMPRPSPAERRNFAARHPVQALILLEKAGYNAAARGLYTALSQDLHNIGELALLAALAEKNNNYYSSLKIGKNGAQRAFEVGALAHPLGAIPAVAGISPSRLALAYAVARQESEFNPQALSPADARGLLQLLPKTAKAVAGRQNLPYSLDKLSGDAGYNARLGVHYLEEQLQKFNGSYILTFIAYNAGAGRALDWIGRYGDPRGQKSDFVVDWLERIPFTETRNYVQRVMENYEIYKMRLGGRADIDADIAAGRPG